MRQVFAHCGVTVPYVAQLVAIMPDFDRYTERSLVLARHGDIVCLPSAFDVDLLQFLASLGLGPRVEDIIVVPQRAEQDRYVPLCRRILDSAETFEWLARRIQGSPQVAVHPFIASVSHAELVRALEAAVGVRVYVVSGTPRLVDRLDRKDVMRMKAHELGLPIADGETVRLPYPGGRRRRDVAVLRDTISRYLDRTGRVLVRGAFGAAGSSSFIIGRHGGDIDTLVREITHRADNDAYLVEVMVEATASPNVQMHVAAEDGTITCVGVTEQRWSRPLAHAGNVYPCTAETVDEMMRWSYTLAEWLRSEGYLGVAGFDFVEYREPKTGARRVLFAEVNPRVNGSTFPLMLLHRLNEAQRRAGRPESLAFVSATVETSARTFAQLRDATGHLFYQTATATGAVPYSSMLLSSGKYSVAVFGPSREAAIEALAELKRAGNRTAAVAVAGIT